MYTYVSHAQLRTGKPLTLWKITLSLKKVDGYPSKVVYRKKTWSLVSNRQNIIEWITRGYSHSWVHYLQLVTCRVSPIS